MTQGVGQGLDRLVSRALAYYRAPALHADALAGDALVPDDLADLFRLAGGAELEELGLALNRPQDRSDVRDAARFYIEQILFRADADHYRLLGLRPEASETEIKEHHRLLIRLIHPDRGGAGEAWQDVHAGRINRAYNTLRDPEARARYDTSLATAALAPRETPPPTSSARMVRPAWQLGQESYPPANRRGKSRAPIFIMAGVVLLAAAFVLTVYVANMPVSQPGITISNTNPEAAATQNRPAESAPQESIAAGDAAITLSAQLQAKLDAVLFPPPAATRESMADEGPGKETRTRQLTNRSAEQAPPGYAPRGPGQTEQARAVAREVPLVLANTPARAHVSDSVPETQPSGTLTYAKNGGVPLQLSAQVGEAARPGPLVKEPASPAAVLAAPSAPTALKVAEDTDNRLTEYDLGRLFTRLSNYYERGDLQNFMALFDESARAEVGGKRQIRQDYDNLFRATESRRLEIGHANWSGGGETFIGKVPYRAMVKNKGDDAGRISTGVLYMEVTKRGSEARITAMFYTVGDRS